MGAPNKQDVDARYAEVSMMLEALDRLDTIIERDPGPATDHAQELEHGLVKRLAEQVKVELTAEYDD